jgi:LDH2 family malate/lactate/ureidoglycolate dehydrogenase
MRKNMESEHIPMSVAQATQFGVRALQRISFSVDEAATITATLMDAELCGYPALGLARILTIAEHVNFKNPRTPVCIEHETPVSARMDGGNYPGFYAVNRAVRVAIEKAKANRFALVGMHNSWLSGRSAYYIELIARAGFAGIHFACSEPVVVPPGGKMAALGTNPIAFGLPCEPHPLILDMATSATNNGDVVLASRLKTLLPEGVAIDKDGNPTRDPVAALAGGILTFGGHKGFGLSLIAQAMGLFAGAPLTQGRVQDFGFLFVVFDPGLLMPPEDCKRYLAALIASVKATPRQPGVDEIRIPSERAFAERERRLGEGVAVDQRIHERIAAL